MGGATLTEFAECSSFSKQLDGLIGATLWRQIKKTLMGTLAASLCVSQTAQVSHGCPRPAYGRTVIIHTNLIALNWPLEDSARLVVRNQKQ